MHAARRLAAWFACWLIGGIAFAQTIDDVAFERRGDTGTWHVRLNASASLLQALPAGEADFYTLRVQLLSADEAILRQGTDELRRLPSRDGLPAMVLSYAASPGSRVKQFTLQLEQRASLIARQGPNSRTIDLSFRLAVAKTVEASPSTRPSAVPTPTPVGVPTAPIAPTPSPAAVPSSAPAPRYVVVLQSLPMRRRDEARPIPPNLAQYDVRSAEATVNGEPGFEVLLGDFESIEQAQAARTQALARFPEARVVVIARREAGAATEPRAAASAAQASPTAGARRNATAINAAASSPPAAAAPASAPTIEPARPEIDPAAAAADPQTEDRAAELLRSGLDALAQHRGEEAMQAFDELLKLPPNRSSIAAQEAIGQAWEALGDNERAIVEYRLYLRLYPGTEGATRVAQRLSALGAAPLAAAASAPRADAAQPSARDRTRSLGGSIAQYYYGGKARSKSLVNIATGIDQATLTRTTESAIVTSADLSARWAGAENEVRGVLRGSTSTNLLTTSHSSNAISAAYLDYRHGPGEGLALRVGRQSPISGGLLGLFDGVSATYPVRSGMKLDVMGGVPANALVSAPSERLFATVLEADQITERWGGNLYVLDQTTQGITNRRALGGEARYAGEVWSLNALADYDTLFRALNAISVHVTLQAPAQTSVTLLVDERRAPSLQLTNALISAGAASLKDLLRTRTIDQVLADALATSAVARQFLASVARPLSESWQMAVDVRYSQVGALPAVGDFAATPATGGQYTLSGQLTGSNLVWARDIHNVNVSVITTPFFKGWQLAYNNLTRLPGEHEFSLEPSVRLYTQTDKQDVKLLRFGPGLRATYKASRRASLLGEMLVERSKTDGPGSHDTTVSAFFYVGYRYELF